MMGGACFRGKKLMPSHIRPSSGRLVDLRKACPHSAASERVAQVVEHVTFNHGVEGSSPSALTKKVKNYNGLGGHVNMCSSRSSGSGNLGETLSFSIFGSSRTTLGLLACIALACTA